MSTASAQREPDVPAIPDRTPTSSRIDEDTADGQAIAPAPPRIVGLWLLLTGLVAGLLAVVPLISDRRYYYADDTVNGAFGQWFHTGMSLREGHLPILDPSIWSSGNFLAEGQWGTYNPAVLLLSYLAAGADSAALFVTVLKGGLIALAACGVYALATTFGARRELAAFAGVSAPFAGFTIYFDATSWVTGLMAWALIPWAWCFLHRTVFHRANPAPLLVTAYLLVTIGYVHGTIAWIFVMLAVGVQSLRLRDVGAAVRVVATAVFSGLLAITVHLPSLLTAPVTNRAGSNVFMDQFMGLDLSGIAMGNVPTALPQLASWWWPGLTSSVPIAYLSWALPMLAFVDWSRARRARGIALQLTVAGTLFFLFLLLPTVLGPLRYPVRMLPYVATIGLCVLAVGLSRYLARPLGWRRLVAALAVSAFGLYLSWAQTPQSGRSHVLAWLASVVAVVVVWGWLAGVQPHWRSVLRSGVASAVMLGTTAGLLAFQHSIYPSAPWPSQEQPSRVADLQMQLEGAVNDTIVVGDPYAQWPGPDLWQETLLANLWYVNPNTVINRYQLLGFREYNAAMCLEYLGGTCPELLTNLFVPRAATGLTLADQIRVDTVQIIKSDVPEELWEQPPPGWSVVDDGRFTRTWVRDEPLGTAGGIVHASKGLEVELVSRNDTSVTFDVIETSGSGDNRVTFSRLPWPGYSTSHGELGPNVDGFLLSVDLPADAVGETVTVSFRPPGLALEITCLAIALAGGLAAVVMSLVHRRRDSVRPSDAVRPTAA